MIINESAGPGLAVRALEPTPLAAPLAVVVLRLHDPEAMRGNVVAGHVPASSGRLVRCMFRAMRVREAAEACMCGREMA